MTNTCHKNDLTNISLISLFQFIIFFNLLSYAPPRFDDYLYPDWGVALGWLMTLTVIIGMVVPIFYYCIMTKGGCCDVS